MDKAQLETLLERVEKATGPDRSLDVWIENLTGTATFERDPKVGFGDADYSRVNVQPLTASIDAAIALVERAAGGDATRSMVYNYDLNWHASAHSHMAFVAVMDVAIGDPPDMQSFHAQSYTMPLAILAALLKALIAQEATCAS